MNHPRIRRRVDSEDMAESNGNITDTNKDKAYGSLGALAPSWDGEEARNIDADEIYERFFG